MVPMGLPVRMGGQVPAEAPADDRFHETETRSSAHGGTDGPTKIYDFLRQYGYRDGSCFARPTRRRSSSSATSASCRIAASSSPKASR